MMSKKQVKSTASAQRKPILDINVVSEALESFKQALSCQSCSKTVLLPDGSDHSEAETNLVVHQDCGCLLCSTCISSCQSKCPICQERTTHQQRKEVTSSFLDSKRVFQQSKLLFDDERNTLTNTQNNHTYSPQDASYEKIEYGDPFRLLKVMQQYHQLLVQMNANSKKTEMNITCNQTLQSCLKKHKYSKSDEMNENEHLKSNNVDVLSQYDMKEPPEKADSPVDNEYESLNAESPFLIQKRNSIGGRIIHFDENYDGPSNTGRVGRRKRKRQSTVAAIQKKSKGVPTVGNNENCKTTSNKSHESPSQQGMDKLLSKVPIHPKATVSSSSPGDSVFDFHSQSSMPKSSPSSATISSDEEKQSNTGTTPIQQASEDDNRRGESCSHEVVNKTGPQHESISNSPSIPCVTPAHSLLKTKATNNETKNSTVNKSAIQESSTKSLEHFVTPASTNANDNRHLPDPRRLLVDGTNRKDVCQNTNTTDTQEIQTLSNSLPGKESPIPSDGTNHRNAGVAESKNDRLLASASCESSESIPFPKSPVSSCAQRQSQVTPEEGKPEAHAVRQCSVLVDTEGSSDEKKFVQEPKTPRVKSVAKAKLCHTTNVEELVENDDPRMPEVKHGRSNGVQGGKENPINVKQMSEMPVEDRDFVNFQEPSYAIENTNRGALDTEGLPCTPDFNHLLRSQSLSGENHKAMNRELAQPQRMANSPIKAEHLASFENSESIPSSNDNAYSLPPGTSTFKEMINLQLPAHQQPGVRGGACQNASTLTQSIADQVRVLYNRTSGESDDWDQPSTADFRSTMKSPSLRSQYALNYDPGEILVNSYDDIGSSQRQSSDSSQMPGSNDFRRLLYSQTSQTSQKENQSENQYIDQHEQKSLPPQSLDSLPCEGMGDVEVKKRLFDLDVTKGPVLGAIDHSHHEPQHTNVELESARASLPHTNLPSTAERCSETVKDLLPNPVIRFSFLIEPELCCLHRLYKEGRCLILKHGSSGLTNTSFEKLQNARATHFVTHAKNEFPLKVQQTESISSQHKVTTCERTFPYLVALSYGTPTISADWLLSSMQSSRWVKNEPYRIWGDTQMHKNIHDLNNAKSNEYLWLKQTEWWNSHYGPSQSAFLFAEEVRSGRTRSRLADFVILIPHFSKSQSTNIINNKGPEQLSKKEEIPGETERSLVTEFPLDHHGLCDDNKSYCDLTENQLESLCLILGANVSKTASCENWINPGKDKKRLVLVPDGVHYFSFLKLAITDPSFDFHQMNDLDHTLTCDKSQNAVVVVRSSWLVDSICASLVAPIQQYRVGLIASNSKLIE